MYSSLKKLVLAILPSGLRYRLEPTLRKIAAKGYKGDAVYCPICEGHFSHFVQLREDDPASDLLCPQCGSIQRFRLLWNYLDRELKIGQRPARLLHFSPNRFFEDRLKKLSNLTYLSTDFEGDRADVRYDITQIPEKDESFDIILCYHVLEHIPDDRKAMAELFRILKPNGTALLQVPHRESPTDEDPSITDPAIRLERFGQDDHVRWYNRQDFIDRLQEAGFKVEENRYSYELGADKIAKQSLRENELIFVCKKAG